MYAVLGLKDAQIVGDDPHPGLRRCVGERRLASAGVPQHDDGVALTLDSRGVQHVPVVEAKCVDERELGRHTERFHPFECRPPTTDDDISSDPAAAQPAKEASERHRWRQASTRRLRTSRQRGGRVVPVAVGDE